MYNSAKSLPLCVKSLRGGGFPQKHQALTERFLSSSLPFNSLSSLPRCSLHPVPSYLPFPLFSLFPSLPFFPPLSSPDSIFSFAALPPQSTKFSKTQPRNKTRWLFCLRGSHAMSILSAAPASLCHSGASGLNAKTCVKKASKFCRRIAVPPQCQAGFLHH